MGLVDELRGSRICIDTAPFIYFIEKDPKYLNIIRPLFAEIDAGKIDAITLRCMPAPTLNQLFAMLRNRLEPCYAHLKEFKPTYRDFRPGYDKNI